MEKVNKASLSSGVPLHIEEDNNLEGVKLPYPIRKVISCHIDANLTKKKDVPHIKISLEGLLEVEDTSDCTPFEYPFSIQEEVDVFEDDDGDVEGYIEPGNSIDMDKFCLSLIVSSLPMQLHHPGFNGVESSKDGVSFLGEESLEKKRKKERSNFGDIDFDK